MAGVVAGVLHEEQLSALPLAARAEQHLATSAHHSTGVCTPASASAPFVAVPQAHQPIAAPVALANPHAIIAPTMQGLIGHSVQQPAMPVFPPQHQGPAFTPAQRVEVESIICDVLVRYGVIRMSR